MKKTILSTLITAVIAGSAAYAEALADAILISGINVEQKNAIEATFDKKNILANANKGK